MPIGGEPDLLGGLPDELISHILYFLPVEDATRAKLLARRWRHLYPENPTLEFDITDSPRWDDDDPSISMAKFVPWVDKCLRQFNAPKIAGFVLYLGEFVEEYARKVDEWIRLACGMKAESIVLHFDGADSDDNAYIFPFHILCAGELSHVRRLSLQCCCLPPFTPFNGPVTSLWKLELSMVPSGESYGNFDDIAFYCPNLEILYFEQCQELPSMRHLCGQLNHLKALKLWHCSGSRDFEIHDVNLTNFTYFGGMSNGLDISFKGLNCLKTLDILATPSQKDAALLLFPLPEAAPNLESLTLSFCSWTKEDFRFPVLAVTFKCLKYLRLVLRDADVQNLSKFLQIAPLLQKLEIEFVRQYKDISIVSLEEQLQPVMHNRDLQSQPLQHSLLEEIEIRRIPCLERSDFELAVFFSDESDFTKEDDPRLCGTRKP